MPNPPAMKALLLNAPQRTAQVSTIPIPTPSSNELLIKVHAIALNPVDALYTFTPLGQSGRVVGSDFSGVVQALGSAVPAPSSSHIKLGSKVAGFLQGACSVNDRPGAFAEYLVVPWDLVWRVPEGMELVDAAGVSLCGVTAAQGLFLRCGLAAPFSWEERGRGEETGWIERTDDNDDDIANIFIYGASTSLGMYTAQLARQSSLKRKLRLIGAASKSRHSMLLAKPYSYEVLIDYRDSDWDQQVRSLVGQRGVQYAADCISEGTTVERINGLLERDGRQAIFRSREGGAWSQSKEFRIEPSYGAVWEALGEEVVYQGMRLDASVEGRQFAVAFYNFLSSAVDDGVVKLVPNPVRLMPGGLERVVEDGFALLGSGSMEDRGGGRKEEWMRPVSGEKLVYRLV